MGLRSMWTKFGDWMLGTVGRAVRFEAGLVVPQSAVTAQTVCLVPVIRTPFTVIEGGKRAERLPQTPPSPVTPTRRAS